MIEKQEIWTKIEGFSNYEVSSLGRVKSLNWNNTGKEKMMSLCMVSSGYLSTCLYKDKKQKMALIHRLVANAFIPNLENKPQVNHIDGNKTNNCVSNLEWATREENMKHAISNGLLKPNIKGFEIGWEKSKDRSLKIRCIETNQEFESMSLASRYFGCNVGSIHQSIHKGSKVLKKYHFELV